MIRDSVESFPRHLSRLARHESGGRSSNREQSIQDEVMEEYMKLGGFTPVKKTNKFRKSPPPKKTYASIEKLPEIQNQLNKIATP